MYGKLFQFSFLMRVCFLLNASIFYLKFTSYSERFLKVLSDSFTITDERCQTMVMFPIDSGSRCPE